MHIADVCIDRAGQATYSYEIPDDLRALIVVGSFVHVPLRNRNEHGFVVAIKECEAPSYKVKSLSLPEKPVTLTSALMDLADWASRYYRCSLSHMLNAMVPSPVRKAVVMQRTRLVQKLYDNEDDLLAAGIKPSKRQLEVFNCLPKTLLSMRDACELASCSVSTIERLIEHKACAQQYESGVKEPLVQVSQEQHQLTDEQQQAVQAVHAYLGKKEAEKFLLYGVTGSGKTLVYMELAEEVISQGKQVLILLPEIALTPQLAARFRQRFNSVSIWHSGFTAGERTAAWHAAADGDIDLIIGTRSALFAPLPNIGLIVVDEEHDHSYKQESVPRYQGRDLAIVYAQQLSVPIILGSATPSCESITNVRNGRYQVLQLKNRPPGSSLPHAEIIDMREECRVQHQSAVISNALIEALRECKEENKQSILLLNRRGWSPTVSCPRCAYVCECEHCDISMTWHKGSDRLRCHLCGFEKSLPDVCPVCSFPEMAHKGVGTERLASLINEQIPDLNILRMDADTIDKRQGHAVTIQSFAKGEADCLLGTQMVAKGLNFPRVTLVGVLAADHGLAAPDFRAAERTYQLIAQVAGRAGRAGDEGRVIVQAFDPEALAIDCALHNRAKQFYDNELALREQYAYPPFTALIRFLWKGEQAAQVERVAKEHSALIAQHCQGEVLLGPSPAGISFAKGQYRWHCLVKGSSRGAIQQ